MPQVKYDVSLILNSTLEGSQLILWCDEFPNDTTIATCLSDGRWSIDPDGYSCTHSEGTSTFSKNNRACYCLHDYDILYSLATY